jgi:hypothetical protein
MSTLRLGNLLRPLMLAVLAARLLLAVLAATLLLGGAAAAASGGTAVGTGTGTGTGGGQMVRSGVASASAPQCSIQWHFAYTLDLPNGPINWGWRSTVGCTITRAPVLTTQAKLFWGSVLAAVAPKGTCQICASATSHQFKSFAFNGAGSWYEKTVDVITVPNIGRDTAKGIIVWSFSGGHGKCTEVNADEVQCATTSDAVVVP